MSKFVLAGRGEDGRSTVLRTQTVEHAEVSPPLVAGFSLGGEMTPSSAPFLDLAAMGIECPAGTAFWGASRLVPGRESELHWTATVDFDVILSGTTALVLEDGEVELEPGDCVLIDGAAHTWRPGPEGCEFMVLFVGKAVAASD